MTIVPDEKEPSSSPADSFVADWDKWHLRRLEVLAAVDGPPTLAATFWLEDCDLVPGVDGTWSDGEDGVELRLGEGAEVLVNGVRTRGRVVALSPSGLVGPRLVFASLTAQVTTRQGRRGVRVFDHARAGRLQRLGTYRPDPSFVLKGTYEALPGHSSVSYSYSLESSPREVEVPGVVHFTLSGADYEVTPFLDEGSLLLVFADSTTGTGTRPPSRFLLIEPPPGGLGRTGPVVLDFNRAFLPPCAFSDEFNCPLPPAHHRLGTEVTVGETWARFTDQALSHGVDAKEADLT